MFARGVGMQNGLGGMAGPGTPAFSQLVPNDEVTADSNQTYTAAQILSGWLRRTGPTAGRTDTWPTVDSIVTAMNNAGNGPSVGDSIQIIVQNLVAFALTFAAGTGIVSGLGTLNVAASVTRIFMLTFLSTKPQVILQGNTTNANKILTGFTADQLKNVMPGMGVTGTNIGASAVVVGVTPGDGTNDTSTGGKITVDVNSTGTGSNIAITFFPRARLDSIGVLAA